MFTWLVQDIGIVRDVQDGGPDRRIVIETGLDLKTVSVGASISCSGCCLTVISISGNSFSADVSAETLSMTAIRSWRAGTKVNLEPSLHLGDELGGHFVFGHVDGLARLESIKPEGDSYRLTLSVPDQLAHFLAPKGSVSLDGISLTVNECAGATFGVNIIPHTWQKTTLGLKRPGDDLHIEIDMLARYVARILGKQAA